MQWWRAIFRLVSAQSSPVTLCSTDWMNDRSDLLRPRDDLDQPGAALVAQTRKKRKGNFSRESSPSLPVFRRPGSASKPQPVFPGFLKDLRACARVSLIPPRSLRLHELLRIHPRRLRFPVASAQTFRSPGSLIRGPVAGPHDVSASTLSLWKISLPLS